MKFTNKIKLIVLATLSLTILGGCGGGGGSDSSFKSESSIDVASCAGAISTWTTVSSGDVVTASSGSQIKFDHDSDGVKKVCVVSGSATVQ